MTTKQEISIDISNYQIMNPAPLLKQQYGTQYSNTGSIPIIFTGWIGCNPHDPVGAIYLSHKIIL